MKKRTCYFVSLRNPNKKGHWTRFYRTAKQLRRAIRSGKVYNAMRIIATKSKGRSEHIYSMAPDYYLNRIKA